MFVEVIYLITCLYNIKNSYSLWCNYIPYVANIGFPINVEKKDYNLTSWVQICEDYFKDKCFLMQGRFNKPKFHTTHTQHF